MPGMLRCREWITAVASGLSIGCAERPVPAFEQVVADATILVPAESEQLASPVDLVAGADGRVYLLDGQLSQILAFDSTGRLIQAIGRDGAGPEELRGPSALGLRGDTLRVVDWGNRRVQHFSVLGQHLGSEPLPYGVRGPHTIRGDGRIVVGTMGFDSALAMWYDERGERRGTLGRPVVPPVAVFVMHEIKNQIVAGEVPDLLRNVVLPVIGESGFWLAFQADPRLQRYDSTGQLQADALLADPTLDAIRDDFFERNRREADIRRFYGLQYASDAEEIDRSLWLLLHVPDSLPSVLLVIDPAGAVRHRVVFSAVPGASGFAVDRANGRIHLASQDNASLASVPLPRGLIR
jgi:hypothetical protein